MLKDRLERFRETDLYVVITERFCAGRTALAVLDEVLAAGVGVVQLREKEIDDRELFDRAVAFRERTRLAGALLIIDDRLDVALAADADGVHLGQRDLPVPEARRLAPALLIGASSHTPEQAWEAQAAGASYVNDHRLKPVACLGHWKCQFRLKSVPCDFPSSSKPPFIPLFERGKRYSSPFAKGGNDTRPPLPKGDQGGFVLTENGRLKASS